MFDKEHLWIPKLKQQLSDKLITRREFVRYSTLLGMSAGAAYMWAGRITGQPFAPPAKRLNPSPSRLGLTLPSKSMRKSKSASLRLRN